MTKAVTGEGTGRERPRIGNEEVAETGDDGGPRRGGGGQGTRRAPHRVRREPWAEGLDGGQHSV